MLGKLLKYDFKAMFKIFLPLWGALLAVSLLNRLFTGSPLDNGGGNILATITGVVYVLLAIAEMVVTVVIVVGRFYRGLLKDEGYLMFTIPVHPWQLITSKLISAMVVSLLSGVVTVASVFILAYFPQMWQVLGDVWRMGMEQVPNFVPMVILILFSFFVGTICTITQVYAALALGHLATNHRVGLAVLAFIGLNTAWGTVATIIGLFGYGDLATTSLVTVNMAVEPTINLEAFSDLMLVSTAWGLGLSLVRSAVHFVLTNYILSRRLNLE